MRNINPLEIGPLVTKYFDTKLFAADGSMVCRFIPSRMPLMPIPGILDDLFEFRKLRVPPQYFASLAGISNQLRWIARAPRRVLGWNFTAGYPFCRLDHLAHGIPAPISEVDELRTTSGAKIIESFQMRLAKV